MSIKVLGIGIWLLWLICIATPGRAQQDTSMVTLNSIDQGKHRFLLVFSPDSQNQYLQEQNRMLRQAHLGLANRNLVVVQVLENKVEVEPALADKLPEAAALRDEYNVKPGQFTLILIGKDGGEKYRAPHAQAPAVLFQIIDQMPMRQQEQHGN